MRNPWRHRQRLGTSRPEFWIGLLGPPSLWRLQLRPWIRGLAVRASELHYWAPLIRRRYPGRKAADRHDRGEVRRRDRAVRNLDREVSLDSEDEARHVERGQANVAKIVLEPEFAIDRAIAQQAMHDIGDLRFRFQGIGRHG
jgi:hypothetical protein